ncbi:MAG: hypothetical protein ACXVB2_00275 [Isosphaeraceae bacterium]
MILSNTVASSVVLNGATSTVNTPADESAPAGFMPSSNGKSWIALPGPASAISALGTAVATATRSLTVDWTTASFFTVTAFGGGWTITFTNAAGVLTPSVGQTIRIQVTGASSSAITFPSTITWITASAAAPTCATNSQVIAIICTATGSSPTYIGWIEGTAGTAVA